MLFTQRLSCQNRIVLNTLTINCYLHSHLDPYGFEVKIVPLALGYRIFSRCSQKTKSGHLLILNFIIINKWIKFFLVARNLKWVRIGNLIEEIHTGIFF